MRGALRISGVLIVAQWHARKGRDNHDAGKKARKIFALCVAEGRCLALQVRWYATVVVSAALEARQPSTEQCGGKGATGRCPPVIYPQATGTRPINQHLLRNLPVTQVQLDEMWNFIGRKHACETDPAGESLPEAEDGRQWVWVSFAPEFRLIIATVVGPRTLDTAKEVVAATKARVAGLPAFFSDGFTCYLAALIAAFHIVTTFARTGKRGRPRQPRCESHPDLVYGQFDLQ
jgi:hypothetical protein